MQEVVVVELVEYLQEEVEQVELVEEVMVPIH
jgi:hypothetical protein